jgi:hypothetical protein
MSYRLGESDEVAIMAQVDGNVDGRKSNSRIICEKKVAYLELLFYLVLLGKILISLWFKTKRPCIAVKSFKSPY